MGYNFLLNDLPLRKKKKLLRGAAVLRSQDLHCLIIGQITAYTNNIMFTLTLLTNVWGDLHSTNIQYIDKTSKANNKTINTIYRHNMTTEPESTA